MKNNIIFDQWLPYTEYEKNECDISLHDGKTIYHVYPNAGFFTGCCGKSRARIPEKDVVQIRYRKYYELDLCQNNDLDCNKKTK